MTYNSHDHSCLISKVKVFGKSGFILTLRAERVSEGLMPIRCVGLLTRVSTSLFNSEYSVGPILYNIVYSVDWCVKESVVMYL